MNDVHGEKKHILEKGRRREKKGWLGNEGVGWSSKEKRNAARVGPLFHLKGLRREIHPTGEYFQEAIGALQNESGEFPFPS